jgi:hypothetical protein
LYTLERDEGYSARIATSSTNTLLYGDSLIRYSGVWMEGVAHKCQNNRI